MALRRPRPEPVAAPTSPLVTVLDVCIAARPGYSWPGLPGLVLEAVEVAQRLGLSVVRDVIDRPSLSPGDAANLYAELT